MGTYPILCCRNWGALNEDLAALSDDLVSVVAISDPFGDYDEPMLRGTFDRLNPYRQHFIIDTSGDPAAFVSKSHRAYAARARRMLNVALCEDPVTYLDDWVRLFAVLAERHAVTGARRFSRAAFDRQLRIPGTIMFKAMRDDHVVGMDIWYLQGERAYDHLTAVDEEGYELQASYALKWHAIHYFAPTIRWLDLGGGRSVDGTDGLSAFKRGWATGTRTAWLCGRVLQTVRYAQLTQGRESSHTTYFPAYRSDEFA